MAMKLDLSQLTEEELQHVFHVVQRDMNLRKKEDERLGKLKCRIEEEGVKRKFLTKQAKFNEGHCIHCLEPFQFLVNGKRRCLDCSLNTCKSCSKFNKKEYGWVCDSCRIVRIVKTGSLDWFYNHVKSRFKNFGSAKVMRSLTKRLQSGEKYPLPHLDLHCEEGGFDNASDSYLQDGYNPQMMTEVIEEDEDTLDNSEAQRYSTQRRNKRLLSVHPFDFDMDSEYSAQSRRPSLQLPSPHFEGNDFQSFPEFPFPGNGAAGEGSRKGSLIDNPELSSIFRSILQEKSQNLMPDQVFSTEVRLEINARRQSLERSCKTEELVHHERKVPHSQSIPGIWVSKEETELQQLSQQKHGAQYHAEMDSSENDEAPEHPVYYRHFVRHRNRSSSQENSGSGGHQISDLSKRMSSIERMLSRLEEKITPSSVKSPDNKGRHYLSSPAGSETSGLDLTDADLEEVKLKKKLDELASNISDRGPSSEEELKMRTENPREMSSSSEDLQNDTLKHSSALAPCDITAEALRTINATEKTLHDFAEVEGTTNEPLTNSTLHLKFSEKGLSASEADEVYRKHEENVSEIENRIAALSAAGMNVSTVEKSKSNQDGQATMAQQPSQKKSPYSNGKKETKTVKNETRERNVQHKGSLTQRNPSNKSRRLDRVFGKPVMSMQP